MENRFHSLAKSVSSAISRREAFSRLGSGLGGSLVASLGVAEDGQANCLEHCCVIHCVSQLRGHGRCASSNASKARGSSRRYALTCVPTRMQMRKARLS